MSLYELFCRGSVSVDQLVQDGRRKVRAASEPVLPGESIGAQIRNASRVLQLDYGLTRRAWYGYGIGRETYPVIYNAWAAWIEREAAEAKRAAARPRDDRPATTDAAANPQLLRSCYPRASRVRTAPRRAARRRAAAE